MSKPRLGPRQSNQPLTLLPASFISTCWLRCPSKFPPVKFSSGRKVREKWYQYMKVNSFSICQNIRSVTILVENFHSSFSKWWLFNLFSFLVPSAVRNIHVSPNGATDSLTVSWTPGGGDIDSYTVSAFRQNQKVESQTLSKHISEHTFHRLEAGEQYQIMIASVSGSLKNQVDAVGRTGECPPGEEPNCFPRQDSRWTDLVIHKSKTSKVKAIIQCSFKSPFHSFFLHFSFIIEIFRTTERSWRAISLE